MGHPHDPCPPKNSISTMLSFRLNLRTPGNRSDIFLRKVSISVSVLSPAHGRNRLHHSRPVASTSFSLASLSKSGSSMRLNTSVLSRPTKNSRWLLSSADMPSGNLFIGSPHTYITHVIRPVFNKAMPISLETSFRCEAACSPTYHGTSIPPSSIPRDLPAAHHKE